MTTISVEHTDEWVMADLTADSREWTREIIRTRAKEEELDLPEEQIELLADVMLPALESALAEDIPPIMVFFLLPEADVPVSCSVTLRAEELDDDVVVDDLLEALRLPEEMLEQPALEEVVSTPSGEATHLVQRYRAPVNAEYELVQEHEAFVWAVASGGRKLGMFLSTSHLDLVQAGIWRPKLVELASALVLESDEA
jgi:hypothetical protein